MSAKVEVRGAGDLKSAVFGLFREMAHDYLTNENRA